MNEIEQIIEKIRINDTEAQTAVSRLVAIGMPAVPAILDAIRKSTGYSKVLLRATISQIHDPQIVPMLTEILNDANIDLVMTAFQSLGECYHYGYGSIKHKSKALQYFKLASDGGNVCGKNMLAYCYEMGLGISPDHKKAFNFYKQAADAGHKLAQQNVAKCYQKGVGVAMDSEAADYWLEKANQE